MAVLIGKRLSDVPERAIVINSVPIMSAQIAKVMIRFPGEGSIGRCGHARHKIRALQSY